MDDKLAEYRAHALAAETRALNARTEESRRAWLIVARDWTKMAERLEACQKEPASKLNVEALIGEIIAFQKSSR